MLWTKLDWEPPPPKGLTEDGQAPPEVAMMGGLVKLLQLFVTRRPDPVFIQRGVLGVELSEGPDGITIKKVLADSPAARAELLVGDRITRFQGKDVKELGDLHDLVAEHAIASRFKIEVLRNGKKTDVEITTEKGL
jgi:S1-C subfamily serine protease